MENPDEQAIQMTEHVTARRRGSYGIDAPFGPAFMAFAAALEIMLAIISGSLRPLLTAMFILAILVFYLYATLRGKFVICSELLDQLNLRGDERILDLGCGRGAVLLMAAQHLTTGRAVGVDLWRSVDQSGNSAEATRRNAIAEGVADRVELHTADMTALPLEDDSFDVVVSNWAIHNIRGRAGREKAISEAVRVLRPGGRLMIADLRGTRQYQAQLDKLGMKNVASRRLGWRLLRLTRLVTATKPERSM
jgi:SAM-dependent methyltransferase